ncbi:MAG: SDR family NAD(P)-dependent oxidoreductase, partial [Chitinophagaceae bacterium]
MEKTVLVTGASAGIGKATAIYLAQSGYNVYGAAR